MRALTEHSPVLKIGKHSTVLLPFQFPVWHYHFSVPLTVQSQQDWIVVFCFSLKRMPILDFHIFFSRTIIIMVPDSLQTYMSSVNSSHSLWFPFNLIAAFLMLFAVVIASTLQFLFPVLLLRSGVSLNLDDWNSLSLFSFLQDIQLSSSGLI